MAKFGKVTEETQELIDKISNETGLIQFIDIEAVSVPKSKKVIDIKRCPPLGEHVAGKSEVVCVIVYEKAFERLDSEQQELLMRDAFNMVYFDTEKDKITIGCPQIVVSCSGRAKWGDALVNTAETAVLAIQQIEEEIKKEKERAKGEKAAKRRNNKF